MVESAFAMVLLVVLALGVIEVALTLYARNVVLASAHEGARAAIEVGADPGSARAVATHTVRRSAGRLVEGLRVSVADTRLAGRSIVHVVVTGKLRPPGPLPALLPVSASATLTREEPVP